MTGCAPPQSFWLRKFRTTVRYHEDDPNKDSNNVRPTEHHPNDC
jgi:hypothetical protein